jgi:hypothetical protein
MAVKATTLGKLHHLETLYRQGYRSDVVDQSLDKFMAVERATAQRELAHLEQRLKSFEVQYQMSSDDFYLRFRAGELGDAADFVEWSVFYEMRKSVQERLRLLESEPGWLIQKES